MLVIRDKQKRAFRAHLSKRFENKMIVHIEKFYPDHYAALSQENTRELIKYGIESAAHYDIVSERDVCKFIDLMIVFGPDFDKNPDSKWASDILTDATHTHPGVKVDALYDAGMVEIKASL